MFDIFGQKRRYTGQKTIRERLSVYPFDNIGRGQFVLPEELFFQFFPHLVFQQIADQQFAQYGPAAFVAKDKPQRRYVGRNLLSVVKARVRARSHDADDARRSSAGGFGCRQHVGIDFNQTTHIQTAFEHIAYDRDFFRNTSGSEEMHFAKTVRIQLRK